MRILSIAKKRSELKRKTGMRSEFLLQTYLFSFVFMNFKHSSCVLLSERMNI